MLGLSGLVAVELQQTPQELIADLGNGHVLQFAQHEDLLLGLSQNSVDGTTLTRQQTVMRPLVSQEWEADRWIAPFMRLKQAQVEHGKLVIDTTLLGTTAEQAFRSWFVFQGDVAAAEGTDLPAAIEAKRQAAKQAHQLILDLVKQDPAFLKIANNISQIEQKKESGQALSGKEKDAQKIGIRKTKPNLPTRSVPAYKKNIRKFTNSRRSSPPIAPR